jgi:hypothetical protein
VTRLRSPLGARNTHKGRPGSEFRRNLTTPPLMHHQPVAEGGQIGDMRPRILGGQRQFAGQLEFGHGAAYQFGF